MRPRLNPPTSVIAKESQKKNPDGLYGDVAELGKQVRELQAVVFGGITLGTAEQSFYSGNLNGQIIDYVFTLANTIYKIEHGLDRKPVAAIALIPSVATIIFDPLLRANWSSRTLDLQCNVAGARILMLVL